MSDKVELIDQVEFVEMINKFELLEDKAAAAESSEDALNFAQAELRGGRCLCTEKCGLRSASVTGR